LYRNIEETKKHPVNPGVWCYILLQPCAYIFIEALLPFSNRLLLQIPNSDNRCKELSF